MSQSRTVSSHDAATSLDDTAALDHGLNIEFEAFCLVASWFKAAERLSYSEF